MKHRLRLRRFKLTEVGWMSVAALAAVVLLALFQQHSFTTRIERVEKTTTRLVQGKHVAVPIPGPRGDRGAQGPKGDTGAQGPPGVAIPGPRGQQGVPGPAATPRPGSGSGSTGTGSPGSQPTEPVVTTDDLKGLRSELLQLIDQRLVDLQKLVGELGTSVDGLLYKVNRLICPLLRC